MFIATKIESTIKPAKLESLNNGVWYYNYDIVEKVVNTVDMSSETEKEELHYEYVQVRINGEPTLSKCYEEILKAFKNEQGTSMGEALKFGDITQEDCEEIYYNVRVDLGLADKIPAIEQARAKVIKAIDEFDNSSAVNGFYFNGIQVWLPKETRVGLMNSLTIEKNAGKQESTLWFDGINVVLNCDAAIQMLSSLELYALECYNKTAEHKNAVASLTSIEEINNYDYTVGYPEKISFNV